MEDKQQQDASPVEVFSEDQQGIISELITKQVSEVESKYRSEVNGLNRRNSELENKLKEQAEEYEKSKLSTEEQFKYELDKKAQDLAVRERELVINQNKAEALKYASENGIPIALVDMVDLADKDAMNTGLEKLKTVVDGDRASAVEAFKKNGGDKPPAGGSTAEPGMIGISELRGKPPEYINKMINSGKVDHTR